MDWIPGDIIRLHDWTVWKTKKTTLNRFSCYAKQWPGILKLYQNFSIRADVTHRDKSVLIWFLNGLQTSTRPLPWVTVVGCFCSSNKEPAYARSTLSRKSLCSFKSILHWSWPNPLGHVYISSYRVYDHNNSSNSFQQSIYFCAHIKHQRTIAMIFLLWALANPQNSQYGC